MDSTSSSDIRARLIAEIGSMRFEAIGHFLSDGDYKAHNEGDYPGAFADYMEAWSLLVTVAARSLGGSDILEGISEFAVCSGDPVLQEKATTLVAAHRQEMSQGNPRYNVEER